MKQTKHTPGPWFYTPYRSTISQQPKCKEKARFLEEKLKEVVEYADSFLANPPHDSCAKDFIASLRIIAASGLPESNQLPFSGD